MSEFQLPEDTAEDRVLAATEFLDPSKFIRSSQLNPTYESLIIPVFSRYSCSKVRPLNLLLTWTKRYCLLTRPDSYRADIVLMLNRGLRRLTVSRLDAKFGIS